MKQDITYLWRANEPSNIFEEVGSWPNFQVASSTKDGIKRRPLVGMRPEWIINEIRIRACSILSAGKITGNRHYPTQNLQLELRLLPIGANCPNDE
jgi:hypothetical protein